MNLPDIRALEWSEEILTAVGIERGKLPDIVESMEVVASIFLPAPCRAGAARFNGLRILSAIPKFLQPNRQISMCMLFL